MKYQIIAIALCLICNLTNAQNNKEEQAIVDEGKALYRSEMASWYGTDIFLDQYRAKAEKLGGYFSYEDGDVVKCVFFTKSEPPVAMAIISFDSTYNVQTAKIDTVERGLTTFENDLYEIRKLTLNEIENDKMFSFYENTNFNIIPLIRENTKKVFVITGPEKQGVVIIGNDYLLTFNKSNKLSSKKKIHQSMLPFDTDSLKNSSGKIEGAIHSHLPSTGDLITSTDICTLMLYSKFVGWKMHTVVGEKLTSFWNCEENTLGVVSNKAMKKIMEHQKEEGKEK